MQDIAKVLNDKVYELNAQSVFLNGEFKFYQGQTTFLISDILSNFAPCGKVAFLYFQSSFDKYSNRYTRSAKSVGYKCTNVILPDDFHDAIEHYSGLFNLAEDIRMIITRDVELYNATKYFATVRNIPCVLIYDSARNYGLLSTSAQIKNGRSIENFTFNCDCHFIIDANCFDNDSGFLSDVYAHLVSHALSLADYRINCFIKGENLQKLAYQTATQAVKEAYVVFSHPYEKQAEVLIKNLFVLELANAICGGALTKSFCGYNCYLLDKTCQNQGNAQLHYAIKCAKIYALYLSGEYSQITDYPDYLTRAIQLGGHFNHPQDTFIKNFTRTFNLIDERKDKTPRLIEIITPDITNFIQCSNAMLSTFKALKGQTITDFSYQRFALKHCGDCLNYINGMTLVRESGITEKIE